MNNLLSHPFGIFAVSLVALSFGALLGDFFGKRGRPDPGEFTTIVAGTFTLLSLIIGFSFAMAISRYDQRKTLEEGEANAIGTAYARADLLPAETAATVRNLLKKYLDQRVVFYRVRDPADLSRINAETTTLQAELWSAVVQSAQAQPTPPIALVVSGMNDVLNSRGYTQAAWWNRIPHAAWELMAIVAFLSNLLFGYAQRRTNNVVLFVLPVLVAFSFALIADIDSPRGGIVRVSPQNLLAASQSLRGPQ
jgi:hypothetical protein